MSAFKTAVGRGMGGIENGLQSGSWRKWGFVRGVSELTYLLFIFPSMEWVFLCVCLILDVRCQRVSLGRSLQCLRHCAPNAVTANPQWNSRLKIEVLEQ